MVVLYSWMGDWTVVVLVDWVEVGCGDDVYGSVDVSWTGLDWTVLEGGGLD